jgi:hypothetical protein
MTQPLFSESLPLGRDTDIQIRSNILSPWRVTMTITDRGDVIMVDLNEEDLYKLSIMCKMAINSIKEAV